MKNKKISYTFEKDSLKQLMDIKEFFHFANESEVISNGIGMLQELKDDIISSGRKQIPREK